MNPNKYIFWTFKNVCKNFGNNSVTILRNLQREFQILIVCV